MADEIKRVGLVGEKESAQPRKPDKYPDGTVVAFKRGSPEEKAWDERYRAIEEEDDDISDLDELEEVMGMADGGLVEDEEYTANLGRNLEEARTFKHRPGVDAVRVVHGQDAGATRHVVLIRHGETELNDPDPKKDRIRGWEDIPLNDNGREEAEQLGRKLAADGGDKPDFLVTSDLSRARETAAIISEITGIPIVWISRAFRPWNVGGFVGMRSIEAVPVLTDHYMAKNPHDQIPGGESFCDFRDRFFAGVLFALARRPGTAGIVAHHRNERALDGWREAGFPADHNIDIETFGKQGESTGKCMVIDVPVDRLAGESDDAEA